MNTFNLLNIYFYKITELRKFCNKFNLVSNGTKTNIITRILNYYLINTHNRKIKLCNDMRCKTCFYNSFLSNSKSICWDYIKNNLHPRYVCKNSHNKFIFNCDKCKHEFTLSLGNLTNDNNWCCYCSNQKLCKNNCDICFNKSFASHEKSIYWNNKNLKIPREVFRNTNKLFIFNCNKCNHEFEIKLSGISKNYWCQYCANQKLCKNNCNICFNKSFASHEKSKYWSNKNIKTPQEIFRNSNKLFIFNCNKCNHEFTMNLNDITSNNQWCNYCGNKILCENNDCEICLNKSFASHEKSIYWNNKNIGNPREYFKNSHKIFIFNCNNCEYNFSTSLNSITQSNNWCPICVNKTEKLLYDYFTDNKINFIKEYTITNGKFKNSNKLFRYDFYLQDLNILIELDGIQHFEFVKHWKKDFKLNQYKDCFKMKFAINNINNVKIIRISQEDVYKNKIDYKELLQELLNTNTLTNLQQITYISADTNLYDKHTQYMKLNITELNF